MGTYRQQCRQFLVFCLMMFAFGMALPLVMAFTVPSLLVPPAVWNFLQIGGLTGTLVFWFLGLFASKPTEESTVAV